MGFLSKIFDSDNKDKICLDSKEKNIVDSLIPKIDQSIMFIDKDTILADEESKYIMKFYYLGFIDAICQDLEWDDFKFVATTIEILQHIGLDYSEIKETILLYDKDSEIKKGQEYIQEGAKEWMNKSGMSGLQFLLIKNRKI